MSGVPTSLGFIGGPEGVEQTPGLDFDPMAQDPMMDPSAAYDVPPLAFDRNQIPKWVQSAKDQLAKSYNTNSLLDDIFSGPNAGMTLDQIEQSMQQQALMGAVDQDLAMGLVGSEDQFAQSMQKLQALMGQTPALPEQAPLGAPGPAASIVSGIAAALTPEHAFEIGAVPFQIEQRKQIEENERRMLEFKYETIKQQALVEAQQIDVQLQGKRLEWAQEKLERAERAKAAALKADESELARNETQYYRVANQMTAGKERISEVAINNYVRLAEKIGMSGEDARKEALRWQKQKDAELASEDATKTVQQIRLANSDAYLASPEGAAIVANQGIAAVNRIIAQYEYADKGQLELIALQLQKTLAVLSAPSKQMMMTELREANAMLRFNAEMELDMAKFKQSQAMDALDVADRNRRTALMEKEYQLARQKLAADIKADEAKAAGLRAGADGDPTKLVQASVKEARGLAEEYGKIMSKWTALESELTALQNRPNKGDAEEARIIGIRAEMAGLNGLNDVRKKRKEELYEQIRSLVDGATQGMTPEDAARWAMRNGVTKAMLIGAQ